MSHLAWTIAVMPLCVMHARAESDLERLVRGLTAPSEAERVGTIEGMWVFGSDAVPFLRRALADPTPGVRLAALGAIREIGIEAADALPEVRRATRGGDPIERIQAVAALGALGRAAWADMAGVLVTGDASTAEAALDWFARRPRLVPRFADAIAARLSDESVGNRVSAASLLLFPGSAYREVAAENLARAVGEAQRALEAYLDLAVSRAAPHGGPLVPHLERLLRGPHGNPRDVAVRLAGFIGPPASPLVPLLLPDLRDRLDPRRREAAALALAEIGSGLLPRRRISPTAWKASRTSPRVTPGTP